MTEPFSRLTVSRKTGLEPFHASGEALGFSLLGFWQWMASDLVSNATRGRLAEYLVARSLGLAADDVRDEWAAFDLRTASGLRVEVKSAAYLQSWHQSKLSSITFVVPKTRAWDPETNVVSPTAQRQADVYVFALLAHTDKGSLNPLDVTQWRFYVLPTGALDARTRSQHSITLKSLEALCAGPVAYLGLQHAIEECGRTLRVRSSEPAEQKIKGDAARIEGGKG